MNKYVNLPTSVISLVMSVCLLLFALRHDCFFVIISVICIWHQVKLCGNNVSGIKHVCQIVLSLLVSLFLLV